LAPGEGFELQVQNPTLEEMLATQIKPFFLTET